MDHLIRDGNAALRSRGGGRWRGARGPVGRDFRDSDVDGLDPVDMLRGADAGAAAGGAAIVAAGRVADFFDGRMGS